ncbi:Endosulphine family protein [Pyrenophora tritici-repentis]|uniref:mRNA stability protein n=2 Tax=Pyrenophora tritici-repentis TaxID=45151 RepID=A0A922NI35_9PLEO|nr:endosulphine family protein [Pyrenophora tritici-repentis Pt-1C-BFP]EDU46678.1 endosulphine family protein [Pyrenophora tritici-repentis Pt-1C-BFP]KAI1517143.1 Endosulphine family protein [Pyrenophora tritici-repentis]KAI1670305.1 Endosulphine family protein [Pyrenophora tritici-repentis]KAI1681922.1 Endosulphine family protein [Pyrenophora tritici-repentis]
MNPHQQNKVDISKMSEQEAKLFRLYGKLPNKKDLLQNKLKERKYFDSGDYALSKAGKAGDVGVTQVGREHPNPEKIPHIAPPTPTGQNGNGNGHVNGTTNGQGEVAGSPVKEHTFLHRETSLNRETSASDFENTEEPQATEGGAVKA